jgi:DNA-binding GntR family transcriptional regulator
VLVALAQDGLVEHVHSAAAEHLEIVQAIVKRDPVAAEHLLAAHIENSKRHALELFLRRTHPPPR